ncbi:acyltransferase [Hydrogenophaga sp. A37]|uniref:LolA-related protein n=1 Tax=Hydrogenophaga sp. A37 TaxID=1945864 RepID=UPI0009C5209D|nr:LolA-related protein [Hydrogenophaga sp. A37]OOG79403.1 acyltransferase [Hydrogenophaga sp. A37]
MLLRSVVLALAGLGVLTAAHAAYDIDQLMTDLAGQKGGRARFVEKRHVALLDKPVQASGEMVYSPPDRLEKRTLLPKAETMVLDKDTLSMERGQRKLTINLQSRPEALAFVDSIRSTLAGNRKSLEQNYALKLQGESAQWVLTLVPSEPAIAALLQRITVTGSKSQVRHIEYLQVDGDRSEISIEPIEAQ